MEIFKGTSLFEGFNPIATDELINESANNDLAKDEIKTKFYNIGIFEAEQLVAITNSETKKKQLVETLKINFDLVQSLIDQSKAKLADKSHFYLREGYQRKLGLRLPEEATLMTEQFEENVDFRCIPTGNQIIDEKANEITNQLNQYTVKNNAISFLNFIPFVKDQQDHPTCAAFAATASNEYRVTYLLHKGYRGFINLSESSLFCEAKRIDGISYEQGTTLSSIGSVLGNTGQAKALLYPYEHFNTNICTYHDYRQSMNSGDLAHQKAGTVSVNPKKIEALKIALENHHLPYVGIELFESIWNVRTNENGFINMPLKNEKSVGGHAICLVGYFNDTDLPGGGAFIFKNSWGHSWSFDNILNRSGFGILSFKYVKEHCRQAFLTT